MKRTFFVDNAHACLAMLCLLAAVVAPETAEAGVSLEALRPL